MSNDFGWSSVTNVIPQKSRKIEGISDKTSMLIKTSIAESDPSLLNATSSGASFLKPLKKTKKSDQNEGVEFRNKRDIHDNVKDSLALKARVYDELKSKRFKGNGSFLINFEEVEDENKSNKTDQTDTFISALENLKNSAEFKNTIIVEEKQNSAKTKIAQTNTTNPAQKNDFGAKNAKPSKNAKNQQNPENPTDDISDNSENSDDRKQYIREEEEKTLAKIRSFNRSLVNVKKLEEKFNEQGDKSQKDSEKSQKDQGITRKKHKMSFEDVEEENTLARERLMLSRNRRRELALKFMKEGKHYSEAFRRDEHGSYVYS